MLCYDAQGCYNETNKNIAADRLYFFICADIKEGGKNGGGLKRYFN